jgi:hypothetical protein
MYGFVLLSFRNKVEDSVGVDKGVGDDIPDGKSDYEEPLHHSPAVANPQILGNWNWNRLPGDVDWSFRRPIAPRFVIHIHT